LQKLFPAASFSVGGKQAFVLATTTWFNSLNVLAYIADGGALPSVVLFAAVLWVRLLDGVLSDGAHVPDVRLRQQFLHPL
jgi:tRNA G37 N-methylase TrmD